MILDFPILFSISVYDDTPLDVVVYLATPTLSIEQRKQNENPKKKTKNDRFVRKVRFRFDSFSIPKTHIIIFFSKETTTNLYTKHKHQCSAINSIHDKCLKIAKETNKKRKLYS